MMKMEISERQRLSFGVFWIISDNEDLDSYKLLYFNVHCDRYGNPLEEPIIALNSKSGMTYNHKAIWDSQVKNSSEHRPYNKKEYNYYPRGRVEVSNNKATVYLSPVITLPHILAELKAEFGLSEENIFKVKVVADNSAHYACFIKKG